MRLRLLIAVALLGMQPTLQATAQSYDEIEGSVRRRIEDDRARTVGDCSRAMVSWLGLRFTEADQNRGKAQEACAAAQKFALRNGVPFLEALPKVAEAMGGTLHVPCPSYAIGIPMNQFYSGCRLPQKPYVAPSPSAWDLARAEEVRELARLIQRDGAAVAI